MSYFVLACVETGRFPMNDGQLISSRQLTMRLDETNVYDERNDPQQKLSYYNALYKGVTTFEIFTF